MTDKLSPEKLKWLDEVEQELGHEKRMVLEKMEIDAIETGLVYLLGECIPVDNKLQSSYQNEIDYDAIVRRISGPIPTEGDRVPEGMPTWQELRACEDDTETKNT